MNTPCRILLPLAAVCWAAAVRAPAATSAPAPALLLRNADLEADADRDGKPDHWPMPAGATWESEGGNRFLRLSPPQPGKMVLLYLRAAVPAGCGAMALSYRVRYEGVKPGEKSWYDGRIMMHFKNAAGKTCKPSPKHPNFRGTSKGWLQKQQRFRVPKGAAYLEFMPTLFQARAGTLDFDDVRLTAIDPSLIPPPPPPRPIVPSKPLVPAAGAKLPPPLHVEGNRVKDADGKTVWLQGLSVDSLQWAATGENVLKSIPVAVEQWHANVIRLAVKDDFWFGRGKWQQKDPDGLAYRKLVDAAVAAAGSRGAYLVLDLHRFGAPTPDHVRFWKDAATRYKNHPAVLLELFNEPHDITWKVWRDGGLVVDPKNPAADVNPDENHQAPSAERTTGMQALVDAVRATGARNIVIVGGLDWSYDLSGVAAGYALTERPGGRGIVYSAHFYPWKKDWQKCVLAAAEKFPIFVGEVGCPPDYSGFQFIPEDQRYPLAGWAQDVLGMIQKHKLHWTGFSFHPKCGPMVISDWKYTPTPYWGVYVKAALGGKTFEVKRMR